jgi:hypothetical protein
MEAMYYCIYLQKMIELTAVVIEGYHCYQLYAFYPVFVSLV